MVHWDICVHSFRCNWGLEKCLSYTCFSKFVNTRYASSFIGFSNFSNLKDIMCSADFHAYVYNVTHTNIIISIPKLKLFLINLSLSYFVSIMTAPSSHFLSSWWLKQLFVRPKPYLVSIPFHAIRRWRYYCVSHLCNFHFLHSPLLSFSKENPCMHVLITHTYDSYPSIED